MLSSPAVQGTGILIPSLAKATNDIPAQDCAVRLTKEEKVWLVAGPYPFWPHPVWAKSERHRTFNATFAVGPLSRFPDLTLSLGVVHCPRLDVVSSSASTVRENCRFHVHIEDCRCDAC